MSSFLLLSEEEKERKVIFDQLANNIVILSTSKQISGKRFLVLEKFERFQIMNQLHSNPSFLVLIAIGNHMRTEIVRLFIFYITWSVILGADEPSFLCLLIF